ncbi:unnamed protein product [Litomosoides sigmodontis]|uniref:Phosphatidic acid phosphatase type 2/haloperoxidase domain-containing protein n=1 Tax=Litomosoides sigmodontis TaxID=42156 RepID=A0A3P6SP80_LITSI|nr:unnamed protein product [Litomosoides sigmodontis]
MSSPHSRAQSEVFSASQYDGPIIKQQRVQLNYFIIPIFILSVVGLACLWTLWYYVSFTTVFPYHQRVFQCRDVLLYRPNFQTEDFNLYVSYALLYSLGFTLPPFVMFIGEIMFWLFSTKPRKTVYASCGECKIHLLTRRLARFIGVFMFGALTTQIFVYAMKFMTGYHRPYFLSLCRPNISACTGPLEQSPSPSPFLACLYRNPYDLRYASLSFPSLHAAFSSYSCTFASCYIYYMIGLRSAPLLRPFLIFGFMGLTLIDSFSRISGYKNHWRDIWCHAVQRFREHYYFAVEKPMTLDERVSPFFQWVYEEDIPQPTVPAPASTAARHRRSQDRIYEVTTTTESFHRTISPPQQQQQQQNATAHYSRYSAIFLDNVLWDFLGI